MQAISDTDDDNVGLKINIISVPGKGNLTVSGNAVEINSNLTEPYYGVNEVKYTPTNCNQALEDSFTYKVNDTKDLSTSAYTVTLSITCASKINSKPIGSSFTQAFDYDGIVNFVQSIVDSDNPLTTLEIKLMSLPTEGILSVDNIPVLKDSLNGIRAMKYTPKSCTIAHKDEFTYKVYDGED
jgi:hypothetical protein